jgi:predicted dehydrogenase
MIYMEDSQCGMINVFYNDGGHEVIGFRPMRGYYNELLNFYNVLAGQEAIAVTPEVEIGDLRTVYAILQSITEEEVIKVDKTSQYVSH